MTLAVYPKGIVPWLPRVDLKDIVYAKDPNTLAAEIGAIENTLGTMPHVETAPPVGPPITYATVSARIHDVLMGNQEPVVTVSNPSFNVPNSAPTGTFNSYNKLYDPFGWYNGNDITIGADGWYTLSVHQTVEWHESGYMHLSLYVDSTWVADDHWNWDFPENTEAEDGGRWNQRNHVMGILWQGIVHSGQRIRAKTENGTGKSSINVTGSLLRVKYDRRVSHTQTG
jgi:hypothetical protein